MPTRTSLRSSGSSTARNPTIQVDVPVRSATPADLPAIQSIYAHHVLHGLGSFEEVPPSLEELRRRQDEVCSHGLPYLVAGSGDQILGYAYCNLFRTRSAYRYALENSVYVKENMQRRGVGKALLTALVERSTVLGYRQMIAVIGDSANTASIALHAGLGFVRVGTLRSAGVKFGRWVDTVMMQRPLGSGDGTLPEPDPAV